MCRPWGFENYVDMTRETPRSISNSGTWMPIFLHILRRSYRLNLSAKDSYNPVCHSLCPSVCYLPEIRSLVSAYLFQSRLPASLFTRSVIQDPATNTKLHCLQGLCVMLYYRVGPEIPVLIHTNSTDTFGDTCRASL